MCSIYYNSWLSRHKKPFGAVEKNGKVSFSITIDLQQIEYVYLVVSKEGCENGAVYVPMHNNGKSFDFTYSFSHGKGLYFYYFKIQFTNKHGERSYLFYGTKNGCGGEGTVETCEQEVSTYQLTCFEKKDPAPQWYRDAVFYQIFPDRFDNGNPDQRVNCPKENSFIYGSRNDSPMYIKNDKGEIIRWDFYGGNLLGITKKIPYLKELGVTALYLNPIFEAASNHRYDTANYMTIDSMLGDEDDFKELIDTLHENDMHIILDGVFSHVGRNSLYFNYDGRYGESLGAARNPRCRYSSWFTFENYPETYKSWWGIADLPEIDKANEEFQSFIYGKNESVVTKWTDFGVDGWRLDVADELPDYFINGIRENLNRYKRKVLIGEVWEDASNKISYDKRRQYILGGSLHGVMNYPFRDLVLGLLKSEKTPEMVAKRLTCLDENYPKDVLFNNLNNLGTHDTERLFSILGENQSKLISAFAMMTVLVGVPCIYYGDEVGMLGGKDPENRGYFPWDNADVQIQIAFKKWIRIRKSETTLKEGEMIPFYSDGVLGIIRHTSTLWSCYIVNPNDEAKVINVDELQFTKDCPISKSELKSKLDSVEIPAFEHYFVSEQNIHNT